MPLADRIRTEGLESRDALALDEVPARPQRSTSTYINKNLKIELPSDSQDVFEQARSITTPNECTSFCFSEKVKTTMPAVVQNIPRAVRRAIRNEAANDRHLQTLDASSQRSARAYWSDLSPSERRLHLALHTAERQSWRPVIQLALVSIGRGIASSAMTQLTDVVTFGGPNRQPGLLSPLQNVSNSTTVIQNPGNLTEPVHLGFWIGSYAIREGDNITSVVFGRMRSGNDSVIDAMNRTLPLDSPLPANGSFENIFFDMAHALLNDKFNDVLNRTLLTTLNETVQQMTGNATVERIGEHTLSSRVLHNKLVVGVSLTTLACVLFAAGAGGFYIDGRKVDKTRAALNGGFSVVGMLMVLASTITTQWGKDIKHDRVHFYIIPLRLLGSLFILCAVPRSFATSEIVNGDARIPYRSLCYDYAIIAGAFLLMTYSNIQAVPGLPFPASEVVSGLAMAALIVGCSLVRTQNERQKALLENARRQEGLTPTSSHSTVATQAGQMA